MSRRKKWQFQASQAFSLKTCAINKHVCHTENRMTECWLVEIGLSKLLSVVLSLAQSNALFSIFPFNRFSSLWLYWKQHIKMLLSFWSAFYLWQSSTFDVRISHTARCIGKSFCCMSWYVFFPAHCVCICFWHSVVFDCACTGWNPAVLRKHGVLWRPLGRGGAG